jgi:hypothetical protein
MKRVLLPLCASAMVFGGPVLGGPVLVSAAGAAPLTGALVALEEGQSDQSQARREMQAGNILSSREIEAKVIPTMRGAEYLGFAYDSTAKAYRLKFLRDGKVVYVDVDARTGRVLRTSE